jgi:hypothetical protein
MDLLPPEVARTHSTQLLPVIALHGMVELHDAIKASLPQFQHISKAIDFKFPPNKPPRALDSHDADVDAYLLRWKTLRKYCAEIPSVQVLIFDCPPERSWAGAEPLIVTFIANAREHRRKNPNCRIFILLLDTNVTGASPLHSAFDDKIKSLRKHAELDENQVAYVSKSDLVPGNATAAAVCKSVKELSQRYYLDLVKSLKKKQSARHPVYNCRLQFKKGLASELSSDLQGAIKYYHRSFKMLQDIPATARVTEHKLFASFINFKLCSLFMSSNAISNAKDQFRQFVLAYSHSSEHEIFKFQHLHFMAFQHKIFAQLLEHSQSPSFPTKRSITLPSSIAKIAPRDAAIGMACHPGYYYQQAANLLSKRRKEYQVACSSASITPPPPAPDSSPSSYFAELCNGGNEGVSSSGVVGLRPIVLDPGSGIPRAALIAGSIQVATEICELLNKAVDQYQNAGARRVMFFLLARVAHEQLELKMYEQARENLISCMSKFGQDGWLPLRSDCGQMLLQLSLATLDTVTMVRTSLLLLHPEVAIPIERKLQLEQAVFALLNGQPSMGLQPMQVPLIMQVDQHHCLLRCCCSWAKSSQIVEQCGVLQLRVTSTCSVRSLTASSLFVDMNPANLSFTVSHAPGAQGVQAVEFKDGAGAALADLSLSTQDCGSELLFSVRVDSVGLVHPKSFTFTIGSGDHSLQVAVQHMLSDRLF